MNEQPERTRDVGFPGAGVEASGYPRRLIVASARLLDLQYRLWQRDFRDPEQPLLEYGFRLSPDPAGIDGRICRYDASDGQATILLGGAILHGRPEGRAVAVDRNALTLSTAWIHEWSTASRIVRGLPREADTLVPRLISWIGGYEQWVLDTWGERTRADVVAASGYEEELPALWWKLAAEWRATLAGAPLAR